MANRQLCWVDTFEHGPAVRAALTSRLKPLLRKAAFLCIANAKNSNRILREPEDVFGERYEWPLQCGAT